GLARLLILFDDLRPAQIGLARPELAEDLELLLAVEQARDVRAEIAEEGPGIGLLVPKRNRERGRRDEVAPLGRAADVVVEVERVEIADGARKLLDLAALDGHGKRRILLAHDTVELDRHQPWP